METTQNPNKDLSQTAWFAAFTKYLMIQQDSTGNEPEYDLNRFEASFGFDKETEKTVAIIFCEEEKLINIWKRLPEVSEYGYWDNTDKLSNISRKKWNERASVWDRVLGDDSPAERMISFSLRADPIPDFDSLRTPDKNMLVKTEEVGRHSFTATRFVLQEIQKLDAKERKSYAEKIDAKFIEFNDIAYDKVKDDFTRSIETEMPKITVELLNSPIENLPVIDKSITAEWEKTANKIAIEILKEMKFSQ